MISSGIASDQPVENLNEGNPWYSLSNTGDNQIHFYFFWSETCPHCLRAKPFVESLEGEHSWLIVHSLEISTHPENARRYIRMAQSLNRQARVIPAFLFCGQMHVGFQDEISTGNFLTAQLRKCQTTLPGPGTSSVEEPDISLPLIGTLDPSDFSLPVLTVILAGLDAFNPCAFFVLLFLLSLLIHAHDRKKILVVGGIFVFFSGFVYFVFMTAWLNVFLLFGELRILTLIAGALALIMGGINIKDFFLLGKGVSLSIPEKAKPGLFERMTGLVQATTWPSILFGTVILSVVANAYEFLCTAGFPMVFTRVLTLNKLPLGTYYLYLVLYNMIYVIPLVFIVLLFTLTLGSRKLQEREGRILKLFSGLMMAGLGLVLLIEPSWLNQLWTAITLVITAVLITFLIQLVRQKLRRPQL